MPEPSEMQVEFALTPDDIAALRRTLVFATPRERRRKQIFRWWSRWGPAVFAWPLCGALAVVRAIKNVQRPFSDVILAGVFFLAAGLLWGLLEPWIVRMGLRETIRNQHKSQQKKGLLGPLDPMRVRITPDAVEWEQVGICDRKRWRAVEAVADDGRSIMINVGAGNVVVVPRRVFASESQADAFSRAVADFHARAAVASAEESDPHAD